MKKIIALVLALSMILSVSMTSASAGVISDLFGKNDDAATIDSVVENIKKGMEGTGLIFDRDYSIEVENLDRDMGYRIHIIQPLTGKTLFDTQAQVKGDKVYWDQSFGLPEVPTEISIAAVIENVKTALDDSGIRFIEKDNITVTRTSADGFKILIVNPLTGETIFNKVVKYEDTKTLEFTVDVDSTNGVIGELIDPNLHYDNYEPAEEPVEETVVEEETPVVVPTVIDESTPLAAMPATEDETIAKTGDTAFAAMAAVSVLAGAAFVVTSKKHS